DVAHQRVVAHTAGFLPRCLGRDQEGQLAEPQRGRRDDGRRHRRLRYLRLLSFRCGRGTVVAHRQGLPRGGGDRVTTKSAGGETVGSAEAPGKTRNWYIVHTYSGFEERVRQNLKQRVEAMGMQEAFGDIRIPT